MSAKQQQPQDSTDDLDGLDDVLDEFNNAGSSSSSSAPKPPPSGTSNNASSSSASSSSKQAVAGHDASSPDVPKGAVPASLDNVTEEDDLLSEAFAAQFAASMEALMKDLAKDMPGGGGDGKVGLPSLEKSTGAGRGAGGSGAGGEEDAKEMNEDELLKQFEKMLFASANTQSEGDQAGPSSTANAGASSLSTGAGKPANFQDAIAASMARIKASDASASTTAQSGNQDGMAAMLSALAAASGGAGGEGGAPDAAGLEELLKTLGNAAGGEGGEEGEEGLARMLENMMDELMSREVLQEPMKDMKNKYPEYFKGEAFKAHPPSEQERYKKQYGLVCQIVAAFEDPAWDDADASAGKTGAKAEAQRERRRKVQELMNEMQDCGAPPDEIVGELPPELEGMAGMGGAAGGGEDCCVM